MISKKLGAALLLYVLNLNYTLAQDLLPASIKIMGAYEQLLKAPLSPVVQMQYISAFPADKKTLMDVFNPAPMDQLYKQRRIYIDSLRSMGNIYPKELLTKAIHLSTDIRSDGDICSDLQTIILKLANKEITHFIKEVNGLKKKEQKGLFVFLADTKQTSATAEYELLISNLRSNNAADMAETITALEKHD